MMSERSSDAGTHCKVFEKEITRDRESCVRGGHAPRACEMLFRLVPGLLAISNLRRCTKPNVHKVERPAGRALQKSTQCFVSALRTSLASSTLLHHVLHIVLIVHGRAAAIAIPHFTSGVVVLGGVETT